MQLRSAQPQATLMRAWASPLDNAVATARTCYSSRVITDDDVRNNLPLRDKIAVSTYRAGHHTTLQHAHFQFSLEHVSRQALWSFFHAHPFYNSEQVSQRYVEVKTGRVYQPQLGDDTLNALYDRAVHRQMDAYHTLCQSLLPAIERLYFGIFPARHRTPVDKRWSSSMQKRAQEVARYVLPIATHAHLYHTLSLLTLQRYWRMSQDEECSGELATLIEQMVSQVLAHDPSLAQIMESPRPSSATRTPWQADRARAFARGFDEELHGRSSRLMSITPDAARVLGDAVRDVDGLLPTDCSDDDATRALLDPRHNALLGESMNLLTLDKRSRALELVHVSFQRKLSHTADSQAQRHRMTPGVRPLLWQHIDPRHPDYITPALLLEPDAAAARATYDGVMVETYADIERLVDAGVAPSVWQYLLPNAVPVRYRETGSLLDQHHKWTTRLCYNAQEEIWRASLEEVEQVAAVAPALMEYMLPPCGQRQRAGASPYCPEGDRFCGVPVWQKPRSSYLRVL
jgi:thymidylate synthase ThyX